MPQVAQPQQYNQQVVSSQAPSGTQLGVGSRSAGLLQKLSIFWQRYQKILLILVVVVGGLWLVKALFFKPAIISVVGTGRLTAKPAQVEMLVTKVDSNPDPILAIMAGEESINSIMAKAKELAGEGVEVQKSFYQVTPSVVTGDVLYQVVNVFKVTAQDPTKASDLIKGFYSNGATTVSGVNFIPAEREKVTQAARKAAIKDAKEQARSIARAAGKRVGRVVSIGDDQTTGNSTVSTDGKQMAAGQEAPAQVNYANGVPAELDIAKSMTVTYEIW